MNTESHLKHRNTTANLYNVPGSGTTIHGLHPKDRRKIKCISYYVIIQSILVFLGIASILHCFWKPDEGLFQIDVLSRIMYLYDTDACGTPRSHKQFMDLYLKNDTQGLPIRPITYEPVFLQILTKLSGKLRTHVKFSLAFHIIWSFSAVLLFSCSGIRNMKILKVILQVFRWCTVGNVIYDVCMAVVYVAHIQQALTKAMIIRYSGWGMTPSNVGNPNDFGGWVPLIAAGFWLRGIVFFVLNMYVVRFIRLVMQKIRGKEVKSKISGRYNVPFPEADYIQKLDSKSLYFRAIEYNKY